MTSARVDLTLNGITLSTAVPAAYVLDVARQLVGDRRFRKVDVPGRAGSWRFDEEPGDRQITITLDLSADDHDDRRAAVRALADWADPGTTTRLIISDEPDRYHDALLDAAPGVLERLYFGSVDIPFLVGPYALADELSTETVAVVSSPDSGSFEIPDLVTAEPVVEITPTNGTLTSFTLTVNGYALSWGTTLGPRPGAPHINEDEIPLTSPDGGALVDFRGPSPGWAIYADGWIYDGFGFRLQTVASGESITVSSISDTVTRGANDDVDLTGTFDTEDLDMSDVAGQFPLLFTGVNSWALTWTGTATTITLDFTWRERFR